MFTIICLGVVFGVFFSFDLFFSAKRKGTFIRQLVVLITTSIPAIYTATIGNDSGNNSIQILWFNFFYPTLLVTLLSSFIVIFLFVYNPLDHGRTWPLVKADGVAIVVGRHATEPERYAAEQLQSHIERRFKRRIAVMAETDVSGSAVQVFLLGQRSTNEWI